MIFNIVLASTANANYSNAFAPTPGYLGVEVLTLTPSLSQQYGLNSSSGAYISQVQSDSPAAAAGLQERDEITSIGATRIGSALDLIDAVLLLAPGTTVQVAYPTQMAMRNQ